MKAVTGLAIVAACYVTAGTLEVHASEPIKVEITVSEPKLTDIQKAQIFTKKVTKHSNDLLDILYSDVYDRK